MTKTEIEKIAKIKIKAAQELQKITERKERLQDESNEKFYPLFENKSRYLVLVGGGGSGKSMFAGRKILERLTTENNHRFLVCRKIARTLRESCFQQLKMEIAEHYIYTDFEINKTDMKITYKPNGNEILFTGLDDVEKMKSIYKITGLWIEEASELEETDLNQLNIRLRGETDAYKQIILTFNPININHWLKKTFFDKKTENTTTLHTTYKDNRFLDKEQIKVLESFKDSDPYYYQVYCLGEWGVVGNTIFNKQSVSERLSEIRGRTYKQGYFIYEYQNEKILNETIKWIDSDDGYIKIFEDVKKGYPYIAGGDTAGDRTTGNSDYFTAQILDNTTGIQVATLRNKFDEDLYAKQMYCLGYYYNKALLSIEVNYSTYPVKELERLGYWEQFTRQEEDNFTHKFEKRHGFKTTKLTRPLVIAQLVEIVREHTYLFNDVETLEEMLTFVRNESGRPEAQLGSHDDLIMALAIAFYSRSQKSFSVSEETEARKPKLIDQLVKQKRRNIYG